jgi:hypothetical protein
VDYKKNSMSTGREKREGKQINAISEKHRSDE